ncbi:MULTISPECIES: alpha/beta hydrolase family protein [Amycolatopsis]|uniref:Alpha/beta hydrolase n=1 Tax=Amycolatopsis dongchuanensis TaxID=1070866 RepID=A0ABP8VQC6_9PSEU
MPAQETATQDRIEQTLRHMADGFARSIRSPILHTPAEYGLAYEDVTFPALDGVPLEGWFIPAPGADRVVIVNHPRWFSRAGLPSHLEPWRSIGAPAGNDFEVDFLPDYRLLHDAGYHVLTYDLRNFGHSGAANGGVTSGGRFEARDVVGSLRYVRGRPELRGLPVGLFSRCLGCNATLFAMSWYPEEFGDVRCLVGCQPLSVRFVLERGLERAGVPAGRIDDLEELIRRHTSFRLDDMSPLGAAGDVTVPAFLYQVRDDAMTRPEDVQSVYDAIPAEKDLYWIEGTTRRWDGYTYFQRDPGRVLGWLDRHLR